LPLVNA
ncbi:unnamed protein product, partial [Leptidea sinapis]